MSGDEGLPTLKGTNYVDFAKEMRIYLAQRGIDGYSTDDLSQGNVSLRDEHCARRLAVIGVIGPEEEGMRRGDIVQRVEDIGFGPYPNRRRSISVDSDLLLLVQLDYAGKIEHGMGTYRLSDSIVSERQSHLE